MENPPTSSAPSPTPSPAEGSIRNLFAVLTEAKKKSEELTAAEAEEEGEAPETPGSEEESGPPTLDFIAAHGLLRIPAGMLVPLHREGARLSFDQVSLLTSGIIIHVPGDYLVTCSGYFSELQAQAPVCLGLRGNGGASGFVDATLTTDPQGQNLVLAAVLPKLVAGDLIQVFNTSPGEHEMLLGEEDQPPLRIQVTMIP